MCACIVASACAGRAGYVAPETGRDVPICEGISCGGSADPVTLGIGISVLVGLTIATLWER